MSLHAPDQAFQHLAHCLYLKTNLEARAAAMFRKVLDLRPDHPGAAAGLRAIETTTRLSMRLPFLKRA